jgi:hypothetical protein
MRRVDVAIVGAGPVGAALAALLAGVRSPHARVRGAAYLGAGSAWGALGAAARDALLLPLLSACEREGDAAARAACRAAVSALDAWEWVVGPAGANPGGAGGLAPDALDVEALVLDADAEGAWAPPGVELPPDGGPWGWARSI